jgi:thiol:disulfide interchange protein
MKGSLITIVIVLSLAGCLHAYFTPNSPMLAGNLLAGDESKYYDYDAVLYQQALADKKIVFLEFYAAWCTYCRASEANIVAAFDELDREDVVGFRVNYDIQTDLKSQFGVAYQHTHIILDKNGEMVYKSLDTDFPKETLLAELAKVS